MRDQPATAFDARQHADPLADALEDYVGQARPLKLPDALLDQVHATMRAWRRDPRAPGWIDALERRLTGPLDHPSSES